MGNLRLILISCLFAFTTACLEDKKNGGDDDGGKQNAIPISAFDSLSVLDTSGGFLGGPGFSYRANLDFETGAVTITEFDTNERLYQCTPDDETLSLVAELLSHKIYYRTFGPDEPIACPGLIHMYSFVSGEETASMDFCGDGYYFVEPQATGTLLSEIKLGIEESCFTFQATE